MVIMFCFLFFVNQSCTKQKTISAIETNKWKLVKFTDDNDNQINFDSIQNPNCSIILQFNENGNYDVIGNMNATFELDKKKLTLNYGIENFNMCNVNKWFIYFYTQLKSGARGNYSLKDNVLTFEYAPNRKMLFNKQ
jgi:hypothetical protein